METKGVSGQVSVEIGDVDHWAEKAATRGREENLRQVEMIPQAGGGRISEVRVSGGSVSDTPVHPAPSMNGNCHGTPAWTPAGKTRRS